MTRTTRKQREAIARIASRTVSRDAPEWFRFYKQLRRSIQPCFDGSGCVMLRWAGMWLGIERDGYTHS